MGDHLYVVTGGPGSGKTTLIEALSRLGIASMPEAGRAIIRDQTAIGGQSLPWADRGLFAQTMLSWDMRSYHEATKHPGPVLMDRGVPDTLGYLRLCNLPVPAHVEKAAGMFRYNPRVFIAPHWPEIFGQDAERKQGEAEARATFEVMQRTYQSLGYEVITLPKARVEDRVALVLSHLGQS
ncbi:AAA family ATPase [Tritonibacter mobilis]|uniref:AAA family ATPase n=1 Tax=Tritonibacter mobilis TaxID=379347 RepID=UPI000F7F72E6|nr:AAA family ATPase [Tritonibacter mobilis]